MVTVAGTRSRSSSSLGRPEPVTRNRPENQAIIRALQRSTARAFSGSASAPSGEPSGLPSPPGPASLESASSGAVAPATSDASGSSAGGGSAKLAVSTFEGTTSRGASFVSRGPGAFGSRDARVLEDALEGAPGEPPPRFNRGASGDRKSVV